MCYDALFLVLCHRENDITNILYTIFMGTIISSGQIPKDWQI